MQAFRTLSFAHEVIFATGAFGQVGEAVERSGWRRLLLCTSRSQRSAGYVTTASSLLGERLVAIFDHVQSHVQETQVAEALALALQHDVDAVIGLGGGSPIGMAKAVSRAIEEQRAGKTSRTASPTEQPLIPVIAIPTTYAGSEMTAVYGITRTVGDLTRKMTVSDPKIAPKLIIYDPLLTLQLPKTLTASSGINALAHSFEALYSITRNPLSTAAALSSIQAIWHALPQCVADGTDIAARSEMLVGAYLAGQALASVSMGLHHGICHVLGGSAGVAHGIANGIMLPHALRFNLDATATEIAPAASAMGIARGTRSDVELAEAIVQHVDGLIREVGLPQRLRDVGVAESDLPRLAQLAFESRTVQSNPKPITDSMQLTTLLRQAW
ncbi:MAG TPA: iron-containing alcohol dehydrogenase family protein [Ktedonobacteraceae bacterium]|nr:iron-containing alcohol dehydrogenase family protein [Ktedonobacteraceae bacterium]